MAPAGYAYNSATQTLTVTAGDGDQIHVSALPASPVGALRVQNLRDGSIVIDEARQVRHLVLRFDGVQFGFAELDSSVRLAGNLTLRGAQTSQTFRSDAVVGGSLLYRGTGAATDAVRLGSVQVGGQTNVHLGDGVNRIQIQGGAIGRNLTVIGGAGADTVDLLEVGDLAVGGSATFNLGDGGNWLNAMGSSRQLAIGGSFAFKSGAGRDFVELAAYGADLRVGKNASFALGNSPPLEGDNVILFGNTAVGRNLSITGGADADSVYVRENLAVGGGFSAALGDGANILNTDTGTSAENAVHVSGSLSYRGGRGTDTITLPRKTDLWVGGGAKITLGDAPLTGRNEVDVGVGAIGGNLSLIGGPSADWLEFSPTLDRALKVGGDVTVALGDGFNYTGFVNTVIGRGLTYSGGAGSDLVDVNGGTIGGNARIALGGSPAGVAQRASISSSTNIPRTTVAGSLRVTAGGLGTANVWLAQLFVGGGLQVMTGDGQDSVQLGLSSALYVAGGTLISLGRGNDTLTAIGLPVTSFAGAFTVRAGAGADTVNLSDDGSASTLVRFGGRVALHGGEGVDALYNTGNDFRATGNFEDFESGHGVP